MYIRKRPSFQFQLAFVSHTCTVQYDYEQCQRV